MEKFSEKQLKVLLTTFKDFFEENDIDSIFSDYSNTEIDEMKSLLSYFGISDAGFEEISFVVALYKLNPDFENKPIVRPKKETYLVEEKEITEESWVRRYQNKVKSYLPVNKEILEFMNDQDEYYYYEGELVSEENYDVTYSEHKPVKIKKIK